MKKIGESFKGIFGGLVFILIAIVMLWWNEGNNVKNIKTTDELKKSYVEINSDKIDSANEGKLVATSGKLINEQELTDTVFNVTVKTPLLRRNVEIYQWEEESHEEDDNTTYTYKKVWSSDLIDSSNFNKKGYDNPTTKQYDDDSYMSNDVKVGAFSLSPDQVLMLSTDGKYTSFNEEKAKELNLKVYGEYLTNSEDINNPNIGDIRVSFTYNNSTDVSVLAVQKGNTFVDHVSKVGKRTNRIMDGIHSGEEMINVIEKENKLIKWGLRLLGLILCISGIAALFKPLSTLANFVPILGGLVDTAVGIVAFVAGLALSLVVIAIAWIRFRPLLGICLLVAALVLIFFLVKKSKSKKEVVNKE